MKSTFLLIFICLPILFLACEKHDKEKAENACPIVPASTVPQVVRDSFALRYPATNVNTWFNKDSVAFCAYFITSSNIEKLAEFTNSGNFISEIIEMQQSGQHEDSTGTAGKVSGGCECEVHKEGD